jgi:hypothetical protein
VLVHLTKAEVVVYSTDFSSAPGWTTDDPTKLQWDAGSGTFHGVQVNREGTYAYVNLPSFDPNQSWRLDFDHIINDDQWSAGLTIGLFDGRLKYPLGAGVDMSIGDSGNVTALWESGPNPQGSPSPGWSTGMWYHDTMEYDASSELLSLAVTIRSTGASFMNLSTYVASFPTDMTFLGVSRLHMKGGIPGAADWATVDYNLDNVSLAQVPEPTSLLLVGFAGLLLRKRRA